MAANEVQYLRHGRNRAAGAVPDVRYTPRATLALPVYTSNEETFGDIPGWLPGTVRLALTRLNEAPTEFTAEFFSPANVAYVGNWVRNEVYHQTSRAAAIDEQPLDRVLEVLIQTYDGHGRTVCGDKKYRLHQLNRLAVARATEIILINLASFLRHVAGEQFESLTELPPLPVNASASLQRQRQ